MAAASDPNRRLRRWAVVLGAVLVVATFIPQPVSDSYFGRRYLEHDETREWMWPWDDASDRVEGRGNAAHALVPFYPLLLGLALVALGRRLRGAALPWALIALGTASLLNDAEPIFAANHMARDGLRGWLWAGWSRGAAIAGAGTVLIAAGTRLRTDDLRPQTTRYLLAAGATLIALAFLVPLRTWSPEVNWLHELMAGDQEVWAYLFALILVVYALLAFAGSAVRGRDRTLTRWLRIVPVLGMVVIPVVCILTPPDRRDLWATPLPDWIPMSVATIRLTAMLYATMILLPVALYYLLRSSGEDLDPDRVGRVFE